MKLPVWLALFLVVACTSTAGPDDGNGNGGTVVGRTATFQGVSATVLQTQDGFLPDNQFGQPKPGFRYFVVEVQVRNIDSDDAFANPFSFTLGLANNSRHASTLGWKEPSLGHTVLNRGESVRAWITYEIPLGTTPVRLFWQPRFDVSLAIPL